MVFKETKIKNIKITDERSKSKGQARLHYALQGGSRQ